MEGPDTRPKGSSLTLPCPGQQRRHCEILLFLPPRFPALRPHAAPSRVTATPLQSTIFNPQDFPFTGWRWEEIGYHSKGRQFINSRRDTVSPCRICRPRMRAGLPLPLSVRSHVMSPNARRKRCRCYLTPPSRKSPWRVISPVGEKLLGKSELQAWRKEKFVKRIAFGKIKM